MRTYRLVATVAAFLMAGAVVAFGQHAGHTGADHTAGAAAGHARGSDTRILVSVPEPMRSHMLANMRDHLGALEEIQRALATGNADLAAKTAETRLGMSSLTTHGAHDIAGHLPKGMAEAGTAMHRAASRFAIATQDASVAGDLKPALAALADVVTQCNGCHAGYRVH